MPSPYIARSGMKETSKCFPFREQRGDFAREALGDLGARRVGRRFQFDKGNALGQPLLDSIDVAGNVGG